MKQTTAEKSPAASRLPVFTEAVANYGLDKFADFSDALVSALRVVNQDKILLGQETVHSYFQSGEMLVVTDNEGQLTRTITPQEREFEARIAQWLSRPAGCVCALYPTEAAVIEVVNYLAEELAHHWLASFFARRRQLWYSLLQILNAHPRSKHVANTFIRTYVSGDHQEFASAMDASDRSSIVLDNPGGRTAGAVPRALPPSIRSAREAFASRVVIACHSSEEWRADPRALWNLVVSNFGKRHEFRKILRVQNFIKGYSPINGESLHAYLTRFEQEIAAIELESPNILGSELAMPLYLQTSLQHIPQCQVVFAKMLGKDNRPYSKYRRYLLNAYEEPNIGHWKMKAMPGKSIDNPDEPKGAAPSTITGAQARSKPPAAAASAAASGGKRLAAMPRLVAG